MKYFVDESWEKILKEVWTKPKEGYYFKKAHAFAYAISVVVHMNLLCEQINNQNI